ncbi:MAG: hydroxymethylbilane synthase [Candidatus Omnitrophota bacterium]
MKIVIGARGSSLSVVQANWVITSLKGINPQIDFEFKPITTTGDRIHHWSRKDKGIFVKEIEIALQKQEIDIAVHSLKDLPTTLAPGLKIGAVTKRLNPLDALITLNKFKLNELSPGAVIGTSSLRRKAQLLHYRPDLKIKELRGNLDTRVKKLREEDYNAIVVSSAALIRLEMDQIISEYFSLEIMLPAVGQGMLGIEIREDDDKVEGVITGFNDLNSECCALAERTMIRILGGGCRVPVAGFAAVQNDTLVLEGLVARADGKKVLRAKSKGPLEDAENIGKIVGGELLKKGARGILNSE